MINNLIKEDKFFFDNEKINFYKGNGNNKEVDQKSEDNKKKYFKNISFDVQNFIKGNFLY